MSAVDSVNTSGVWVSTMPRRVRSATSKWSKPTEMVESAFSRVAPSSIAGRDRHARTDAAVRVFQRGHERVVLRGIDLHDFRMLLQIREHIFGQRLLDDDLLHQLIFLATVWRAAGALFSACGCGLTTSVRITAAISATLMNAYDAAGEPVAPFR